MFLAIPDLLASPGVSPIRIDPERRDLLERHKTPFS
jgi:hypothetical protein